MCFSPNPVTLHTLADQVFKLGASLCNVASYKEVWQSACSGSHPEVVARWVNLTMQHHEKERERTVDKTVKREEGR